LFGQREKIDSLDRIFAHESIDSNRLQLLSHMTDQAFAIDMSLALQYAKRGVALADELQDETWQPIFYEKKGRMFANLMQLDSAAYYFDKAMVAYQSIGNKRGQATTSFKIAWVKKRLGDLEAAMQSDLHGLQLMEELDNKLGIASALGRVSEDLMRQGQLTEALEYAKNAISISEENDLEGELFYALRAAGDACIAAGNNEEAYTYYNQAYELANKLNLNSADKADIINCRGNAYKRQGKYEEALRDYKQCLIWGTESNYPAAISTATGNLGEINLLLGNYAEALPYQLKTIKLQESTDDLSNLSENYRHASTIYSQLGDYKTALAYEIKSRDTYEQMLSKESDMAVSELKTKYETEKKEATIKIQQQELAQRNLILALSVGVGVLLTGLLFFLFRSYKQRTAANKLLSAKNAENELLLKEIHHRVKNNLEVVSGLLFLQSTQVEDEKVKDAMLEGQNRVKSIGILHRKLYQGDNLGAVDMKDYFLNLSENILDTFGASDRVNIQCAMDQLDLDIDRAVPLGLIVNELLTNTMKYAFPDGRTGNVRISLKQEAQNNWHLEVEDDGVGKENVVQGSGFGRQLIALLTTQLNGTMREEISNGTKFLFDFKINMPNVAAAV
jgi:two-component sensor histidine kinase